MTTPVKTGPLIWALTGRNAGDNAQVRALASDTAAACGGSCVDVPLQFNALREAPNAMLGARLTSLSGTHPTPPWPDLVIGVGRRAVPAARWIKAQSNARLVWLGRPRIALSVFDLVLTTPQYGLPDGLNLIRLALPYAEAAAPSKPVAPLMLVGGDSWANRMTGEVADRLASCAEAVAPTHLRITTSPRTPPHFADILASKLPGADFHRFSAETTNPYERWLAEASLCIVTADSVSLIADAVQTGTPTYVVGVERSGLMSKLSRIAPQMTARWLTKGGNNALLAPPPNPDAVVQRLLQIGSAKREENAVLIGDMTGELAAERRAALSRVVSLID